MKDRPRLIAYFPNIDYWREIYDFMCCNYLRNDAPHPSKVLVWISSALFTVVILFLFCFILQGLFGFRWYACLVNIIFNDTIILVIMSFWGITELVEKILKNKYDDYWFNCISEKYNFSMDFQYKYYEYIKAVEEFYKKTNLSNDGRSDCPLIDRVMIFRENPFSYNSKNMLSFLYLFAEIDRLDFCNTIYEIHKGTFSNVYGIWYKSGDAEKSVPWELMPLVYEFGCLAYNGKNENDFFKFYRLLHGSKYVIKIIAPNEEQKELERYKFWVEKACRV